MPSIHKQPGRPHWFCAFTTPDGRRHFKSTGTRDKRAAQDICRTWAQASLHGDDLTPDKARELIARGVETVLLASGQALATSTIRDWCKRWLAAKEVENEPTTHDRYELAVRSLLDFLDAKADRKLESLTASTILAWRDHCAGKLSVPTVNTHLRIVRTCLSAARKHELMNGSPANRVASLKERGESKRREMTIEEIQRVLKQCGNSPWRGLVLTGVYSGQRLGDCARLTWAQIDLTAKTVSFVTEKTGKRLSMSLAEPLADYLSTLPSADEPSAFVFPALAAMADQRVSRLSNAFATEILIPAGLMAPRPPKHVSTGRGRTGKRLVNEVTFHSLRHSFTTLLKAAGASNALAQLIVGHDSPAVSARYTHLHADDTADAIGKLPDVTKAASE
jgi:integrase